MNKEGDNKSLFFSCQGALRRSILYNVNRRSLGKYFSISLFLPTKLGGGKEKSTK